MVCPRCGGGLEVSRTTKASVLNVRRLQCVACRRGFESEEQITREIVGDMAIPLRVMTDRGAPGAAVLEIRNDPPPATGSATSSLTGSTAGSSLGGLGGSDSAFLPGLDPGPTGDQTRARVGTHPAFLQFWGLYPRKLAKAAALRAWIKIDPTPELIQVILEAITWQREMFLQRPHKNEPLDTVPHASTWLNGRRWEDEPGASPAPRQVPAGARPGSGWSPAARGKNYREGLTTPAVAPGTGRG